MYALSEATIQHFYQGLAACTHKSEFDNKFLQNNSLASLYEKSVDQWLHFFKERLFSLHSVQYHLNEYDWTQIGSPLSIDWTKDKKHANYAWYYLASHLAGKTHKAICEIVFSGVKIVEEDLKYITKAKHYAFLIYSDNYERVALINRMLINSKDDVFEFAMYDEQGVEHPISPYELYQIQYLVQNNFYYEPKLITDWHDFRRRYIAMWETQNAHPHFDRLIYPLFTLVSTYFEELENPEQQGGTQALLASFYQQELKYLKPREVNHFYGQSIVRAENNIDSVYLWDIFYDLYNIQNNVISMLPNMVKLAVWITKQNPAMLIQHPLVDECYRQQKMGPYLSTARLSLEFIKLLRHKKELTDVELEKIAEIGAQLALNDCTWKKSSLETTLFLDILEVLSLRDLHNGSKIYTDVTREGILTCTHEYVFYREGANKIYINIVRLLEGAGTLKQFGIADYFLALMPKLSSPFDSVTGEPYSRKPFDDYLPSLGRTYLINLNNSEESYHRNQNCFYDMNRKNPGAFDRKQYDCIQAYSAPRFRQYPRLPKHKHYRIRASTLREIIKLVSNSLNFEATIEGEGYQLSEGFSKWSALPLKRIEYTVHANHIIYQIRDTWNQDKVHYDYIEFEDEAEKRLFEQYDIQQRRKFILNVALTRGHARSNLTMEKYSKTDQAYEEFRTFYNRLSPQEQQNLNNISIPYAGTMSIFLEIWSDGFQGCLSTRSKWFSIIPVIYLGEFYYKPEIEQNPDAEYLVIARRDSPGLDPQFAQLYIDNDLSVPLDYLRDFLSNEYKRTDSLKGTARVGDPKSETGLSSTTVDLLKIVDTPKLPSVMRNSLFKSSTDRLGGTHIHAWHIKGDSEENSELSDDSFTDTPNGERSESFGSTTGSSKGTPSILSDVEGLNVPNTKTTTSPNSSVCSHVDDIEEEDGFSTYVRLSNY